MPISQDIVHIAEQGWRMMIDIGKELQDAFDDGYRKRDAEIIRCKDCHFCGEIDENGWHCCENLGVGMPKNGFCSDAERKEVEE